MLDVTGCTCPTGLVWRGVFDATGVQYKVPEWVVVEPEGIVEDEEQVEEGGSAREGGKVAQADTEEKEDTQGETFDVRIRTSHDARDVVVKVHRRDTVARIVDMVREKAKVSLASLQWNQLTGLTKYLA